MLLRRSLIRDAVVSKLYPSRWALIAGLMSCLVNDGATVRAAEANAPSAERLQLLSTFFEDEVRTGKISGAVVLIQQHGRPVYLKTFGMRDVRTNSSMTTDTIFALRSMTKL